MDEKILAQLRKLTAEELAIIDGKHEIEVGRYMTQIPSKIVDSEKLLEKGKLIDIRTHTRFVAFPQHSHNYVEVVYMCQGQTSHIINGEKILLKKGELLFLNQYAIQEIEVAKESDIAINFIVLPEFFDQSLILLGESENLLKDFLIDCLRNVQSEASYLHFQVAEVLTVQNLVENLVWTLVNKRKNTRNINQVTMGLLFMELVQHVDRLKTGKDTLEHELLISVYQFIESNYKEGLLSDLSESLGYDLYWLSRKIKQLSGSNYTELLQSKRMSQSAYFLKHTGLPISDIGYAVGYNNLSYFYRLFKKKYGLSPKAFRDKSYCK